ncbi:MAG: hypothetical protein Q9224_005576 [Gallowayella concinna]
METSKSAMSIPERMDYEIIESAQQFEGESATMYHKGGYHPAHIGDLYKDSRYKIVHKLGWGGFGTVWLARDRQEDSYVALKIIVADKAAENPELEMLQYLAAQESEHPGKRHLVTLLDHFELHGPNGKHTALVLPLLGPCVEQRAQFSRTRMLEQDVAIQVASQLSQSLAYLHSIGIGHGDCTTRNVVFQLCNIDHWTEDDIYNTLGRPQCRFNCQHGMDGEKVDYIVNPIDLSELGAPYVTNHIMLIDLGLAFYLNKPPKYIGTPPECSAPEVFFDQRVGEASDIWALGCTILLQL